MKVISMIMVVSMMLCLPINAQEQSNKTLVAYFSVTGTTEKAAKLMPAVDEEYARTIAAIKEL